MCGVNMSVKSDKSHSCYLTDIVSAIRHALPMGKESCKIFTAAVTKDAEIWLPFFIVGSTDMGSSF